MHIHVINHINVYCAESSLLCWGWFVILSLLKKFRLKQKLIYIFSHFFNQKFMFIFININFYFIFIILIILFTFILLIIGPLPDYPQTTVDKVASVIEIRLCLLDCLLVSKYSNFSPHPPLSPLLLISKKFTVMNPK